MKAGHGASIARVYKRALWVGVRLSTVIGEGRALTAEIAVPCDQAGANNRSGP